MKSEFLESELELYVQRLLIHEFYSTGNKYKMLKISPNVERLKGYDAEIVGMTSFYCQFKTSDLLTKGGLYDKRQDFCKKLGWPKATFYSFALRIPNDADDKKNPEMWQHSVLHSLWKLNRSGVAYVAPVFHTRTGLDLHEPLDTRRCRFRDHEFGGRHGRRGSSEILIQVAGVNGYERCRLPFFDGLISIPPHVPVKELKHSYCFTSPSDISFHSESEEVSGNSLDEALRLFVVDAAQNEGQSISDARLTLSYIKEMIGIADQDDDFLESFLAFGLVRAGVSNQRLRQGAAMHFEKEVPWLQQRIAFAAALSAYFGISTLGLLKIKEV